jgi:hypothetical protein
MIMEPFRMQSPVSPAVKLQSAQAVLLSLSVPKPARQAEKQLIPIGKQARTQDL